MIVCPICMDTYEDADCYELPNCLHKCCKACLVGTFQQKIIDLQIDLSDFKCPMCNRLFTPDILPEFLPADLYKKYGDHALQFNKIFGLEDYELLTNCLNENCTEKYIIWKDAEYATCPTCNKKFCRKCQLPFHEGITCEVQKEIHKNATYNDLKEKFQVAKCPKCLNACQKISGCNFMYCICKANFCYLCDAPLTEAYHFSHWQNNDPFNSPCRIWQDGNWVDPPKGGVPKPEAKPAEKIVQVEPVKKDNDIPCPHCGSVSEEITQLIYYEKFVKCGSAKCRGQSFCLACKKEVKAFAILDHVDQGLKCKYK